MPTYTYSVGKAKIIIQRFLLVVSKNVHQEPIKIQEILGLMDKKYSLEGKRDSL